MNQPPQVWYSEDRRWWWDGYHWQPVPQPNPKPIPKTSPWIWALVAAALVVIALIGVGGEGAAQGVMHASDRLVNWANGLQPK